MQDYTDDLAAVENSLRRIIERVGKDAHGDKWLETLVKADRLKHWQKKLDDELAARSGGIQEQRLLYFSDFNDLDQIIDKNWSLFEPVFNDQTQTKVYLEKLRELRNPDAHNRELTTGEKSLIVGMASELRTKITRYMATKDTPDEYFPRIESLRDSLGNTDVSTRGKPAVIRVGFSIEFVAEAWHPEGKAVEFRWSVGRIQKVSTFQDWSMNNRFIWEVNENQIGNPAWVSVHIRGPQNYHARGDIDADRSIFYVVLPLS